MAGQYNHASATQYICVDEDPEILSASFSNHDGRLLFKVEARCGSLDCPPYEEGQELACVVCSR